MLRTLQTINGVNVDAQKTAKTDMKRGTLIIVNELGGTLEAGATSATHVLVRDVKVTDSYAQGFIFSEYDDSQDLVKAGEYAGARPLHFGERYATSEYGTLTDAQAAAGQKLKVAAGKLVTAAAGDDTPYYSLGWVMDAGEHKLLGFGITR